jgi:acetyl-CoA carboxylase biotin carboxyl carrier protein
MKNRIKVLSESLEEFGLTEIEYKGLRVSRGGSASAAPQVCAPVVNTQVVADKKEEAVEDDSAIDMSKAVKSPMVGVAYTKPDPDSPEFVKVGDKVSEGTTLCLIEAMKTYNPVKSDRSGTVKKILVKGGDSVEFEQPLFIIE